MAIVKQVMTLGRSGLQDWLIQRISAFILAAYILFWIVTLVMHPTSFTYQEWHALFQSRGIQLFTLISIIALAMHAWVGLWTIFTDYIKSTLIRFILNLAVLLQIMIVIVWTFQILWGE